MAPIYTKDGEPLYLNKTEWLISEFGDDIRQQYVVEKLSVEKVARKYAVSVGIMTNAFKKLGIQTRPQSFRPHEAIWAKLMRIHGKEIRRLYIAGSGMTEIGHGYGTSSATIRNVLKGMGVPARKQGPVRGRANRFYERNEAIVEAFLQGEPLQQISDQYKISRRQVRHILERRNIDPDEGKQE